MNMATAHAAAEIKRLCSNPAATVRRPRAEWLAALPSATPLTLIDDYDCACCSFRVVLTLRNQGVKSCTPTTGGPAAARQTFLSPQDTAGICTCRSSIYGQP